VFLKRGWILKADDYQDCSREVLVQPLSLGESVLELKKQLYLYTDNFQGSGWSLPSGRTTREEASKAVASAELAIAHTTLYSAAELAVWKKHLIGIDGKGSKDKRSALLAFATELAQKGFQKPNWFDIMLGSLQNHSSVRLPLLCRKTYQLGPF